MYFELCCEVKDMIFIDSCEVPARGDAIIDHVSNLYHESWLTCSLQQLKFRSEPKLTTRTHHFNICAGLIAV
jgi:hypothetical protein